MFRLSYARREAIKALPGVLAVHYGLKWGKVRSQLAGKSTLLCVEGYPRSGNSYALRCIQIGLGLQLKDIAHHTHSSANILRAVRLQIPTLMMIRAPLECAASLVVMGLAKDLEDALKGYAQFHSRILPVIENVIVAPFEQFTQDPSMLLTTVSKVMGRPLTNTPDATAKIAYTKQVEKNEGKNIRLLGHPDHQKEALKRVVLEKQPPHIEQILHQCQTLREKILSQTWCMK